MISYSLFVYGYLMCLTYFLYLRTRKMVYESVASNCDRVLMQQEQEHPILHKHDNKTQLVHFLIENPKRV